MCIVCVCVRERRCAGESCTPIRLRWCESACVRVRVRNEMAATAGRESMQRSRDSSQPMRARRTARTTFRSPALPMCNDRNRHVLHFVVGFVSTRILNNCLSTKIASRTR